MFIGRNLDGTIYGVWTTKQPVDSFHPRMEEVPDKQEDVVEFLNRETPVGVDPQHVKIQELESRIASLESKG